MRVPLTCRTVVFSSSLLALFLCACDSKPSSSQTASAPTPQASPAPAKPVLAVSSPFYSESVEAEIKAAGLDPSDFRKGQRHYEMYCTNCHGVQAGATKPAVVLAPPAFAVADHYRKAHPSTAERVEAIHSFVKKPDPEKVLMPGAVKRFGVMMAMPLPDDQLKQIGIFLATGEFEEPVWYQAHYAEEHPE